MTIRIPCNFMESNMFTRRTDCHGYKRPHNDVGFFTLCIFTLVVGISRRFPQESHIATKSLLSKHKFRKNKTAV